MPAGSPHNGTLYVVATPLGNFDDITLRAVNTLRESEAIACEDTRRTSILLRHLGIGGKQLISYHDFNEQSAINRILRLLEEGSDVSLITDAGTPTISDPGFLMVRTLRQNGIPVLPIPGPSALTAALSFCPLPVSSFFFAGFLPHKKGRKTRLDFLSSLETTFVLYESPHRIRKLLAELSAEMPEADVFVARERPRYTRSICTGKQRTFSAIFLKKRCAGSSSWWCIPREAKKSAVHTISTKHMQIITEPSIMQATVEKLRLNRQRIGVVMTMGALHEGHLSLVEKARSTAGTVVLTVFVNPKQFGPGEDFHRYPKPFEQDVALARNAGVDYLFAPSADALYPQGFQTTVLAGELAERFEGEKRPGHFNGVVTVVSKLMQITKPHVAVFGEKDAQQLAVIRRMVRDLNIDAEIVAAPIVREESGLAVSSRNIYLSKTEKEAATVLFRSIGHASRELAGHRRDLKAIAEEIERMIDAEPECRHDYVQFVEEESFSPSETAEPGKRYRLLLAAYSGTVRLIDNCLFEAEPEASRS